MFISHELIDTFKTYNPSLAENLDAALSLTESESGDFIPDLDALPHLNAICDKLTMARLVMARILFIHIDRSKPSYENDLKFIFILLHSPFLDPREMNSIASDLVHQVIASLYNHFYPNLTFNTDSLLFGRTFFRLDQLPVLDNTGKLKIIVLDHFIVDTQGFLGDFYNPAKINAETPLSDDEVRKRFAVIEKQLWNDFRKQIAPQPVLARATSAVASSWKAARNTAASAKQATVGMAHSASAAAINMANRGGLALASTVADALLPTLDVSGLILSPALPSGAAVIPGAPPARAAIPRMAQASDTSSSLPGQASEQPLSPVFNWLQHNWVPSITNYQSQFKKLYMTLYKRVNELIKRYPDGHQYHSHVCDAVALLNTIDASANIFFQNPNETTYVAFRKACLDKISAVRPTLDIHRGWRKLLGNIAIGILSIGIAFLVNYAATRKFTFFNQTKTSMVIEKVERFLEPEQIYRRARQG